MILPVPNRRLGALPWKASLFAPGGVLWDTRFDDAGAAVTDADGVTRVEESVRTIQGPGSR